MRNRYACVKAAGLVTRCAVGLSDAERLVLENHVAGCASCREDIALLDLVARSVDANPDGTAASRDRAIRRAFEALPAAGSVRPRRIVVWSAIAAGVVIAGVTAYVAATSQATERAPIAAPSSGGAAPMPHVTVATPETDAMPAPAIATLASNSEVTVAAGAAAQHVLAGPASLVLETGTRVVWSPDRATLELHAGTVRASVTPAAGQHFRVATSRFIVEVTGTRFEVDLAGVRVEEGHVRVRAPDGTTLAKSVEAGQSWSPRVELTAAQRLARARTALARRDVAHAREEIDRVLAMKPQPRDHADALNLRAECALVDGDRAGAVTLYLESARRFPALSAGENALFAAARLELRLGRVQQGAALLREYIARYPDGRFHSEATRRLQPLKELP